MADDNIIMRAPNYDMSGGSINKIPNMKDFEVVAYTSFSLQLIFTGLDITQNGIFQIVATNDGTNYFPVPDSAGMTFKAAVIGNSQITYMIFAPAASAIPACKSINLRYINTTGVGTLSKVYFSGIPT